MQQRRKAASMHIVDQMLQRTMQMQARDLAFAFAFAFCCLLVGSKGLASPERRTRQQLARYFIIPIPSASSVGVSVISIHQLTLHHLHLPCSSSAETKLFLHSKKFIHLFSFLLNPASRIDRSPCFVKRPSIGSFNSFISSKHLHLPCSSSAETEGTVYIYMCTLIIIHVFLINY